MAVVIGCNGWDVPCNFDALHQIKPFCEELKGGVPSWVIEMLNILEDNVHLVNQKHYYRKGQPLSFIHYHTAKQGSIPSNFVAIGDSVMTINSMFG